MPAILPLSPHLRQNGGLSFLSSTNRKVTRVQVRQVGWVGDDSHTADIPWCKRKCEAVPCRDATAGSFVAKPVFPSLVSVNLGFSISRAVAGS
jgi:hypothetical protein